MRATAWSTSSLRHAFTCTRGTVPHLYARRAARRTISISQTGIGGANAFERGFGDAARSACAITVLAARTTAEAVPAGQSRRTTELIPNREDVGTGSTLDHRPGLHAAKDLLRQRDQAAGLVTRTVSLAGLTLRRCTFHCSADRPTDSPIRAALYLGALAQRFVVALTARRGRRGRPCGPESPFVLLRTSTVIRGARDPKPHDESRAERQCTQRGDSLPQGSVPQTRVPFL